MKTTSPQCLRLLQKLILRLRLLAVLCLLFSTVAQSEGRQVLRDNVPVAARQLIPHGRLDPAKRLTLTIGLPLQNQEELTNLLKAINDPTSPNYRQYLTPTQFAERFSPTEKDYQAVAEFAKANGLTVIVRHPNRVILEVEGAVSDIEKALHVKMQTYKHPSETREFYAPDADPSVDLGVAIKNISGLNDYSLPRPHFKVNAVGPKTNIASNAGSGPSGTYSGNDFRTAYVPGSTLTGSGQTIALVQFDGYNPNDITYYERKAGLSNVTLTNVLLDGFNGNPTGNGGEMEVCLDIEVAIAMAPGISNIIVYEAGPTGNWHDILNRIATDNLAKQISCSWYSPNMAADSVADQIFQQMAAQGQSFFAASGDSDAFTGLIPFPGDTPYITEVGGSTLTTGSGGSWASETVWNWGRGVGSSGGISTQYALPYWQQGINMSGNQGSTAMRNVPDVALTADNIYVRTDGGDYNFGGTSCAAPLWAAFTALVNQQALTKGQPVVGFLNPALYTLGQSSTYASSFHDTTTGNNFSSSSPARFSAATGYDLCTGLGTPAGNSLINALAGPQESLHVSFFSFNATGPQGGPFLPNSAACTLINTGTNPVVWTASATQSWLTFSKTGGTLAVGGSTTVIASFNTNANRLAAGNYADTITFADTNTGINQTRIVSLNIPQQVPILSVTPAAGFLIAGPPTGPFNPSSVTYTVANAGGMPMSWAAGATASWLTVTPVGGTLAAGGTAAVTATLNTAANSLTSGSYNGTVTFTNLNTGEGNISVPSILLVLPPPVITSATSAIVNQGQVFSYQITATNNPTGYLASGLPAGLIFNEGTGLISGTATVSGTSNVTIRAINLTGTGTANLAISVLPQAPVIAVPMSTLCSLNPGVGPYGPQVNQLVQGSDGNFYGTTSSGGANGAWGSVFKVTQSGSLTTLYSFGNDGQCPMAGLVQGSDGNFYGTTYRGGAGSGGTVFKITTSGSLTTLCSFNSTNGWQPYAGLIQGSDGNFYGTASSGGTAWGTVFKMTPSGSLTTLYSFGFGGDSQYPTAGLVQGIDGNFYGTTAGLGSGLGSVFKMTTSGSLTTICSFAGTYVGIGLIQDMEPGLIQGSDGNLYGTTYAGGASGNGTVFKVTTSGSLTTICSFTGTNGKNPQGGVMQGNDGNYYGTTHGGGASNDGTVFQMTPSGSLTTICTFNGANGANPTAGLIQSNDGSLYGTTSTGGSNNGGTVFKLTPFLAIATAGTPFSYQITASNTPASYSASNLPAGLSVNTATGLISGTPTTAGTNNVTISATNAGGTDSANLSIKVLLPPPPVITGVMSVAVQQGQLFTYQIQANGNPSSYQASGLPSGLSLNTANGLITGTPTTAGTYNVVLSAINPGGTGNATLTISVTPSAPVIGCPPKTFCAFQGTIGSNPAAGVIQGRDGNFYGMTQSDGSSGDGTFFQITPAGSYTTLASLDWTAIGAYPQGPLLQANDGNFYGTAQSGGSEGLGTVFRLNLSGSLSILSSFNYENGAEPMGGLVQGSDGNLYGTTEGGGSTGQGTVFKVTLSGSLTTLCSFNNANGAYPFGVLFQGGDGNFYGTTLYGGSSNMGTVFKATLSGSLTALCSFTGSNGAEPMAGLVQDSDGNFYGTTLYGGSSNTGTIFKVTLSGSLTTLCSFNNANGAYPFGVLFQGGDGNFYGTTSSGGNNGLGTVFAITPSGSLTTLYSFSGGIDGSGPQVGLVQATDGNLYGTTSHAGANGNGTAFSITPLYFTGIIGEALSYQISASNNPTNYTATNLPAGLTLNTSTGLISGIPTQTGAFNVTLSAINTGGSGSATLVMTVLLPPPPVITSSATTSGGSGILFSYQITATNSPTSYGAANLPPGLSVNALTGLISGMPTQTGTSNATITATNAGGTGSASLTLIVGRDATFTVSPSGAGPFTYQWQRLPNGGTTWAMLTEGSTYRGVTTVTLTIATPTAAMDGDQFRCVITDPNGSVTSSPAKLVLAQNVPAMPLGMRWVVVMVLSAIFVRALLRDPQKTP